MSKRLLINCLLLAAPVFAQRVPIPGDTETWMDKGVEAYRSGQYKQAISAFQMASDFDPDDVTAHLYLATANMVLFVPGLATPENTAHAQQARTEFKRALELDPSNTMAMQSLASLSFQEAAGSDTAKLDEAREWNRKILAVDPRNKQALYLIAVIDWQKFYPNLVAARSRLGMKPEDPGPLTDPAIRRSLNTQYGTVIEEAISSLKKALEIDPQYDDAMAYMNLIVRQRAELRDSTPEYQRDIQEANEWARKAVEVKKLRSQATTPQRVRVAPGVQAERLVNKTQPVYPEAARQARVQGVVRFAATIGRDGRVLSLQLISGHPLLVAAARDAVRKWIYRPAVVGNTPVEVVTQIDVPFER